MTASFANVVGSDGDIREEREAKKAKLAAFRSHVAPTGADFREK